MFEILTIFMVRDKAFGHIDGFMIRMMLFSLGPAREQKLGL